MLRIASTLYWLVQDPAVPLRVKASMQMEPPAVTCPATYPHAHNVQHLKQARCTAYSKAHNPLQHIFWNVKRS